jgi:hypothetical protein
MPVSRCQKASLNSSIFEDHFDINIILKSLVDHVGMYILRNFPETPRAPRRRSNRHDPFTPYNLPGIRLDRVILLLELVLLPVVLPQGTLHERSY